MLHARYSFFFFSYSEQTNSKYIENIQMATFTVKQGGIHSCLCMSTDVFYSNLDPAGQAHSLVIARFTKGVQKGMLEGVVVSPVWTTNAMVIFPYL